MNSFNLLSDDEQLAYAHALERKGRELVDLILRRRRIGGELGPILPPAEQEAVLAKIRAGLDEQLLKVHAEAVVLHPVSIEEPDAEIPTPGEG